MRHRAALFLVGLGGLLFTPGAVGVPDVQGDPTPPVVTPVIVAGSLGLNGWYTTNVTVNWTVVDPESTILSTSGCDATTLTADTVGRTLTCRAESDGGVTTVSKTFRLDKTTPTASAAPAREADSNGWYNHALTVSFSGSDDTSGIASCDASKTYGGPDASSASVTGTCRDQAGNSRGASLGLKYDGTAPGVSAGADRSADSNSWFNHPVTVSFTGADDMSGLDTCTGPQTYAGPDRGGVSLQGSCRDRAGNQSGSSAFVLSYDATAPAIGAFSVKPGKRSAELAWTSDADAKTFEVVREPGIKGDLESVVYRGSGNSFRDNGLTVAVKYRYTLVAHDGAANRADASASLTARGALLSPAPGERVAAPPRLVWVPVKNASYYNVQLLRDRRVLSAWPARSSFQVPRTWLFKGRRYRLRPGVYRWYVWPGLGRPAEERYGTRIGGSSFVVGSGG
jgi:hypothetical protein